MRIKFMVSGTIPDDLMGLDERDSVDDLKEWSRKVEADADFDISELLVLFQPDELEILRLGTLDVSE